MRSSTTDLRGEETIGKCFYHLDGWNNNYAKIQILTVEDTLNGKQLYLPPNIWTFKKAVKIENEVDLQIGLEFRTGQG